MGNIKVFGHQNPDLDSIASSAACAYLLEKRGTKDVKSCRLGDFNKETKFVLEKFNISLDMPKIDRVDNKEEVVLVDHNEFSQSAENIENASIKMVVDHHKIDNFKTSEPLEYIAKPVGCNSTTLYEMLKEVNGLDKKEILILLLSAIISDTLLFKSPTTTEKDKKVANEIADILGINIDEYGLELLKAGADLSDVSSDGLVKIDSKLFDANGKKIEIAQINAVDMNSILSRQAEIEEAMNKVITEKALDAFIVAVTDILNCNSEIIVLGNRKDIVEKAFDVKLENNRAFLEGVVSRKKQIAPKVVEAAN